MAIEIPNRIAAAAGVVPAYEANAGLSQPFINNQGFQEFDPSTTAADPKGGYTKMGDGFFTMKTVDGVGTLDNPCLFTAAAGSLATGGVVPQLPALVFPPIADGHSIGIDVRNLVTGDNEDAQFTIMVFQISEGVLIPDGAFPF